MLTFIVRVGTPAQTFRVLPSTTGQETWIPVPEGCPFSDTANCADLREVYPFQGVQSGVQYNVSWTWKNIGLYDLVLERNLNYTGNGLFGLNKVGTMVDGGVLLEQQVIAGIATKNFFMSVLGLGPKPSNFSDFEHPQPSFLTGLKNENKIPSLSFACTAGAPYNCLDESLDMLNLVTSLTA
ncbi:hypothetical protein K458DRAFT_452865 [Lentithecium fluviatile CBS 122367]|uniref:Peptidase A1 domain-containing protein n=1 Tax=Lentithecium fluviatile CBS 122367 TaxID=1168545 RepID=A0A6G1IYN6_9PLEO|nr:hypothetical protein K458DRAFT_452865 [Lentithecium fluviatile CBS 122367]